MGNVQMEARQIRCGSTNVEEAIKNAGGSSELTARVDALEAAKYVLTDVPEKELTGTNYEDMAEIALDPGVYHIIASARNTGTSVLISGIRFWGESSGMMESVVTGFIKSVDMIYAVDSQATIKVQVKGSANCKNVKTRILVAKVGDVTAPEQNNR